MEKDAPNDTPQKPSQSIPHNRRENTPEIWDVIVIGGGPAGMMAAGRAAERGAHVLLLEKNDTLGKKLLITGGGRSNITNAEFDDRLFLEKFKENGKYLFSAFSAWSVKESIEFFNRRKMETKIEALQRVFPASDSAQSVWDVLVEYMKQGNVTVRSKCPVVGFEFETDQTDNKILAVKLKNKTLVRGRQFILATGGKSRPETGSTGDGFAWLKELGHAVAEPNAALVPVIIKDAWVKTLQGVTLSRAKLTLFQNKIKQTLQTPSIGRVLFTHFGISGPTVLNMSRDIGELLKYGDVVISLDLLPDMDYAELNLKLQEIIKNNHTKKLKNSFGELIPAAFVPVVIKKSGIDAEIVCTSVTREERLTLVKTLKDIPLHVKGLRGVENAIVTSGGIMLNDIDSKSMRSRRFSNLFVIGDILNIDRPSGGYSLQLCWTTGFVAGNSVEIAKEI